MGSKLSMIRDLDSLKGFVFGIKSDSKCAKVGILDRDDTLFQLGLFLGFL